MGGQFQIDWEPRQIDPNTWLPTGGNWGGPGWSDNHRPAPGEITLENYVEFFNRPVAQNALGIDSLVDLACKDHDLRYWIAELPENQANEIELKLRADLQLIYDIGDALLYNRLQMDAQEQLYAALVNVAFTAKILFWDGPGFVGLEMLQDELREYISVYGPVNPYDPYFPTGEPGDNTIGGTGGHGDNSDGPAIDAQIGHAQSRVHNWYSPLVLDLDGDGLEYIGLDQSNAFFDLTADGFANNAAWLSADDGFLALDENGDGVINNINELFGDRDGDGFEILRLLDTNSDNVINAQDTQFSNLRIWQDLNGDGISQQNELNTLDQYNIASISLSYTNIDLYPIPDVNVVTQGSFTRTDSSTGTIEDAIFASLPESTQYVGPVVGQFEIMNNIDKVREQVENAYTQCPYEYKGGFDEILCCELHSNPINPRMG